MLRTLTASLALATALSLAAPVVHASSSARVNPEVATQIRDKLTSQGYEVRKIENEDGYYEAYVIKDGVRQELYLNSELEIVRTKIDD